jgi:hypothetical protein
LLLKQAKQMAVRFGRQEEDGHMVSSWATRKEVNYVASASSK